MFCFLLLLVVLFVEKKLTNTSTGTSCYRKALTMIQHLEWPGHSFTAVTGEENES